MYHICVKYEDLNGDPTSEDLYFHMSAKEWVKADGDKAEDGGYEKYINRMIDEQNAINVLRVLEDIVRRAYGVKSPDGKKFIKDVQTTEEFLESLAYDAFLDELLYTEGTSAAFIKSIIPKSMQKE